VSLADRVATSCKSESLHEMLQVVGGNNYMSARDASHALEDVATMLKRSRREYSSPSSSSDREKKIEEGYKKLIASIKECAKEAAELDKFIAKY